MNNILAETLSHVQSSSLRAEIESEGNYHEIGDYVFARESDLSWVVFYKGKKIYDAFDDGYESPTVISPNYLNLKKCKNIVRKKIQNGEIKLT